MTFLKDIFKKTLNVYFYTKDIWSYNHSIPFELGKKLSHKNVFKVKLIKMFPNFIIMIYMIYYFTPVTIIDLERHLKFYFKYLLPIIYQILRLRKYSEVHFINPVIERLNI